MSSKISSSNNRTTSSSQPRKSKKKKKKRTKTSKLTKLLHDNSKLQADFTSSAQNPSTIKPIESKTNQKVNKLFSKSVNRSTSDPGESIKKNRSSKKTLLKKQPYSDSEEHRRKIYKAIDNASCLLATSITFSTSLLPIPLPEFFSGSITKSDLTSKLFFMLYLLNSSLGVFL
jgi:hypothetical protein